MAVEQKLELTWIGKEKEERVEPRILMYDKEKSYGNQNTGNMLIHGDNLLALKSLEQDYAGKVKCIYIDPPYNTGSAFEQYDDNVEHSLWLSMMRDRLNILCNLLSSEGSIWISIDDRECAYLKLTCDEIFGRKCFVSNISWQRTYSTRNDSKGIVNEVEHILVYSRQMNWMPKKLPRTAAMNKIYKNPDNDIKEWTSDNPCAPGAATHQGMVYAIQHPFTGEYLYPSKGACWRYQQNDLLEIMCGWCEYELKDLDDADERAKVCGISVDEVRRGVQGIVLSKSIAESAQQAQLVYERGQWPRYYFTRKGKGGLRRKTYLENVGGRLPTNFWPYSEVGHTDEAKKENIAIFDQVTPFATPKPERLIERVLYLASDEGDLVLDSFLGSGTTAAVAHKMHRRYIGIELGEHCYTHCKVRLDKVIDGEQGGISKAVNWQGGGGYRFYELAPSLLKRDEHNQWIFDFDAYTPEQREVMIAEAIAKLNGYHYKPDDEVFWKQGVSHPGSFIYTTTQYVTSAYLDGIAKSMNGDERLLVCCPAFDNGLSDRYDNIVVRKIPQSVLNKCEFGREDYKINVIEAPVEDDDMDEDETDE